MAALRTALALTLLLLVGLSPAAAAGELPRAATSAKRSVPDTGIEQHNAAPTLADFVAALQPHGAWSDHPKYGQVWRPTKPGPDWSPYLRGRWAHTPAGWYWVGDEPWAWATCHYGRWILDAAEGWTWVPGRRWAPAWVSWREGSGLVGWAPLQPDGAAHPLTYLFLEARRIEEPVEKAMLAPALGGEATRATRVIGAPRAPASRGRVSPHRRSGPRPRTRRGAAPPAPADVAPRTGTSGGSS